MNVLISTINILMETCWVHFDNGLDDLCYDVFVELPMMLYEYWRETSILTFDTLDNSFLMCL